MGRAPSSIPNSRGALRAKSRVQTYPNPGSGFWVVAIDLSHPGTVPVNPPTLSSMKRSFDPAVLEMMDRPQPVSAELERDLERIRQLNRWFGSHRLILGFIRRWIRPDTHARIVDLATGSGDIPRLIADCARDVGAQVEIDALDRQPATLEIANNLSSDYPEIFYREANILEWNSGEAY